VGRVDEEKREYRINFNIFHCFDSNIFQERANTLEHDKKTTIGHNENISMKVVTLKKSHPGTINQHNNTSVLKTSPET